MTEHHSFVAPPVRVDAADNASGHTSVRALVTARIFARRLDRQLAVGVVGPAGSALAIHAARLESDNERHSIAHVLRRAVVEARQGQPLGSPSIPVHRRNFAAAEDVIEMITLRLHSPRHVSARGMARLRRLIADGCGPMYEDGGGDLAGRLRAALAAL